jgi:HK97 family phage prohead protease
MTKPTINQKIQKLFNIEVKSIDDETRTVDFVFSDNSVDRYGEIVDQASWDVKAYQKNPVILWGHDPSKAENVIGSGSNIRLNQDGKSIITAQFDDDDHASLIFNKIKKGILRTVSAGFIPHSFEMEDDTPVLKDNELLEVSVVAIPANPNALALDYKAGEMREKDAQYLIDTMRAEANAIEKTMKAKDAEGKTAEELQSELDAAVARAEAAEAERDQAKADLEEATKDAGAGDEEEEEDPANGGGDDDQSGAEELDLDDLDIEAELTDEQEEQLAAELADQAA